MEVDLLHYSYTKEEFHHVEVNQAGELVIETGLHLHVLSGQDPHELAKKIADRIAKVGAVAEKLRIKAKAVLEMPEVEIEEVQAKMDHLEHLLKNIKSFDQFVDEYHRNPLVKGIDIQPFLHAKLIEEIAQKIEILQG